MYIYVYIYIYIFIYILRTDWEQLEQEQLVAFTPRVQTAFPARAGTHFTCFTGATVQKLTKFLRHAQTRASS